METLWAGWRRPYIKGSKSEREECLFCRLPILPEQEALVVARGTTTFIALNRYPYTNGHVMIAPFRHAAEPGDLSNDERNELWESLVRAQGALQAVMSPDGFNMGANLGGAAGAGVPGHFHLHLVPRWDGDANFMTTIGTTRVIPEDLADTYASLRAALR